MSEPEHLPDPLPSGTYPAVVTAADVRRGGTAPYLEIEARVVSGGQAGRTVRGLASCSDRGMEMPGGPRDLLDAVRDLVGDPPSDLRSEAGMAWLADVVRGCPVTIDVLEGPLIRKGRAVLRDDGSPARRARIRRYRPGGSEPGPGPWGS